MFKLIVAAILTYIILLPVIFVLSLIGAIPVWLLWNWLGPSVFHMPELNFWSVWGLLLLLHFAGSAFRANVKVEK